MTAGALAIGRRNHALNGVDDGRARYLKAIDGLPFGDSAQQGLVRGR